MEADFGVVEKGLRASAGAQRDGRGNVWEFWRRQALIAQELISVASAIGDARSGDIVAIVVGSSSHGSHRVVDSVAVGLAPLPGAAGDRAVRSADISEAIVFVPGLSRAGNRSGGS